MTRFTHLTAVVLMVSLSSFTAQAWNCPSKRTKLTAAHAATTASAKAQDIVDTAVGAGSFKTLVTAVQKAGLVETLKGAGPFTVFAPTDDAFAALPAGALKGLIANPDQLAAVLTYHVVPGRVLASDVVKLDSAKTVNGQTVSIKVESGKVFVDGAQVVTTDIACSNGVIHVIDKVILPKDIVDIAAGAGSFNTLAAALNAAGLIETLKGDGPFTVFAPTDAAFAKLPAGTVEELLKPENKDKLTKILTYHVVAGKVFASDVIKLDSAATVGGESVDISVKENVVKVDQATVTQTDILGTNGVIHVIDQVLIP